MGEGQLFGIRQFYTGQSRDLDIRAVGFVNLLRIKRADFMAALEQFPEDKEAFCFIRDKMDQLSYGWASGNQCDACGSFKHELVDCRFLHYVPNAENICLRYSYADGKQSNQKERVDLIDISMDLATNQRREYRQSTRFDLSEITQNWVEYNFEMIENYKQKFLMYQFDYSYIYKDAHALIQEEEEEEEQEEEEIDDDDQGNDTNNQNNTKESQNQEPSIFLGKGNTSPDMKLHKNSESNQIDAFFLDKQLSPSQSKQVSDTQLKSKNNSRKPLRRQTFTNNNSQTNIKAEHHLISATLLEPPPLESISSGQIQNTSSASQIQLNKAGSHLSIRHNINNSSPNLKHCMCKGGSSYSNISSATNIQYKNVSITSPRNKLMSNLNNPKGIGSNMNPMGFHNHNQGKNVFFNNTLHFPQDLKGNQYTRVLSHAIDSMQSTLLQNIERMLEKNGNHEKQGSRNQFQYSHNLLGSQEIFRYFDKQKNFDIYFPQNNLSYILQRRQEKFDKQNIMILSQLHFRKQKKLNTMGVSTSSNNFFHRQSNQAKSDRFLSSPRSLTCNYKNNDVNIETSRFRRYALIDSQIPISVELTSSPPDYNHQIIQTKNNYNNKLSFSQLQCKQEQSLIDFKPRSSISQQRSPTIDDEDILGQDQRIEIHDIKIGSKESYFNLNS